MDRSRKILTSHSAFSHEKCSIYSLDNVISDLTCLITKRSYWNTFFSNVMFSDAISFSVPSSQILVVSISGK